MTCRKVEDFAAGRLGPREFAEHCRGCEACAAAVALDARLDAEIRRLREAAAGSPELWSRIEKALGAEIASRAARLRSEGRVTRRPLGGLFSRHVPRHVFVTAGIAVVVLLAVTAVLIVRISRPSSGILAGRALARVEIKEREYADAIGSLEKLARPKIEAMDLQMVSLYRDKLAAIDAQIDKCREALASNPANAHIRRYLLAALQDKRQTLADVLEPGSAAQKERRNS